MVELELEGSNSNPIAFEFSGVVGSDSFATGLQGNFFGNNGWSANGSLLPTGTEIIARYTIPRNAVDLDTSIDVARFTGGQMQVSIPSLGIVGASTLESYDLLFAVDLGGTDILRMIPSDDTGLQFVVRWFSIQSPFSSDISSMQGDAPIDDPIPVVGDLIGTSEFGNYSLSLNDGSFITTNNT
jgi:hypothetical protein